MTTDSNFEVEYHVTFAGGESEITRIEDHDGGGDLLHVYTSDGRLRKLPSGLPHIEKIDSVVDRLTAAQADDPVNVDLRERATRLDLAYRYDCFLSLTNNRIEIEPYQVQAAYEILNSYDHRYLIGDEAGLGKTIKVGIPIGNARRNLENLRREQDQELAQLEEDRHVTPEEPT